MKWSDLKQKWEKKLQKNIKNKMVRNKKMKVIR